MGFTQLCVLYSKAMLSHDHILCIDVDLCTAYSSWIDVEPVISAAQSSDNLVSDHRVSSCGILVCDTDIGIDNLISSCHCGAFTDCERVVSLSKNRWKVIAICDCKSECCIVGSLHCGKNNNVNSSNSSLQYTF